MIIDFKVSNYRSIYEEQSFNMISVYNEEETKSHVISYDNQDLLRATAIYGPNASGKSNLLESIAVLRDIVLYSSTKFSINTKIPVVPFGFNKNSIKAPTSFEITFVEENIKYIFGVEATRERILEEYLIAYPKKQPQMWYNRIYDTENEIYQYQFGSNFKGQKKTWEKATKKNALFISTAINLQNDENNQLVAIYNWFSKKLSPVSIHGFDDDLSKKMCQNKEKKNNIVSFLNYAGIELKDIEVTIKKRKNFIETLNEYKNSNEINNPEDAERQNSLIEISSALQKIIPKEIEEELYTQIDLDFVYKNGYKLDLNEKSDGTQKLFSIAAYWINSLSTGKVLFIDELNDNLHPALVRLLVDMFNDPDLNQGNAQLIFTTHETSILNQDVLRRDQVWFCDKDENLSTKIYPLSDFKPRKDYENIENTYMSGKYGALPYFKKVAFKMKIINEKDENIITNDIAE